MVRELALEGGASAAIHTLAKIFKMRAGQPVVSKKSHKKFELTTKSLNRLSKHTD